MANSAQSDVLDVCQIEIRVSDLAAARRFYHEGLGWRLEAAGEPGYLFADPGRRPLVGLMQIASPEVPIGVTPYLEVADCAAALAQAQSLGARVLLERTPSGTAGFWAHALDPWGNELAFWENAPGWSFTATGAIGPGLLAHPITWIELRAPDLTAAIRFYRALCGWHFELVPGVDDFAFYRNAQRPVGIGLVSGARAEVLRLTVYAATHDLAASVRFATQAGGRPSVAPAPSPDGHRFAVVADPSGNPIGFFDDRA